MSENFEKLKRQAKSAWAVKALLSAFSACTVSAGVFLLLIKLDVASAPETVSIAVGASAFVITLVCAYTFFHTSDAKIAEELDERFELGERTQTMLAYKDERGAIYELQREDAEAKLSSSGIKLGVKRLWIYLLFAAIGAALLSVAIVYTPKEELPPIEQEIPFDLSDIQAAALRELSSTVRDSSMSMPYRENTASAIDALLEALSSAKTKKESDAAISAALGVVYYETDASSSAVEIINALGDCSSQAVRGLAAAMNYYTWPQGGEWDAYGNKMSAVRAILSVEEGEENDAEAISALLSKIAFAGSDIELALVRSGISDGDALLDAVAAYASSDEEKTRAVSYRGLSDIATLCEGGSYAEVSAELDMLFGALGAQLFSALEAQMINTSVGEGAMTKICSLFGYDLPDFKRPDAIRDTSDDMGSSIGGESEGGGGIGVGTVYGSDDAVLDRNTDELVEYGSVIDGYRKIMLAKLMDGDLSEEEKEAIRKYFDILYGGFEEE